MTLVLFLLLLFEFLLIFLLSRQIFALLYTLFYLPLKKKKTSHFLVLFLFFPGTVIHEFSHAIIAKILGAQVSEINLYPHKDQETGEFKAGSVEIEKVDSIRLSLIGIAPSLVGLFLIGLIVFHLFHYQLPLSDLTAVFPVLIDPKNYLIFLILFIISMTMFASKRDLREFLIVTPVIILFAVLLYRVGLRITLSETLWEIIVKILKGLIFVLGITLIVDLIIYIFLFIPLSLISFLFGRKK